MTRSGVSVQSVGPPPGPLVQARYDTGMPDRFGDWLTQSQRNLEQAEDNARAGRPSGPALRPIRPPKWRSRPCALRIGQAA